MYNYYYYLLLLLLFDAVSHQPTRDQPSQEATPVTSPGGVTVDDTTGGSAGHEAEEAMEVMPPYDRSLVRLLAEIRFISGEVH